jgi:hypothetical protein
MGIPLTSAGINEPDGFGIAAGYHFTFPGYFRAISRYSVN